MLIIINVASQILKQTGAKIINYKNAGYHISKETLTSKAATLTIMLTANNAKTTRSLSCDITHGNGVAHRKGV